MRLRSGPWYRSPVCACRVSDWPGGLSGFESSWKGRCGQLGFGERARLPEPLAVAELDEDGFCVLDVEPETELRLVDASGWVRPASSMTAQALAALAVTRKSATGLGRTRAFRASSD